MRQTIEQTYAMLSIVDPLALLTELTAIPGPPGQEGAVAAALIRHLDELGLLHEIDQKGNVLVNLGEGPPDIVVTAHMDEIAMIVREVNVDGTLAVTRLGGLHPWKLGEGPVEILAKDGPIPGVFGFGGIHTEDPAATSNKAKSKAVEWPMGSVFTGLSERELRERRVRPGTRVVVAPSRRGLTHLGDHIAGYFLDDRADLVSWLLTLDALKGEKRNVLFAATAAEEVGGEGALFLLQNIRPAVCIALELGALVPDAKVELTSTPTVWAIDGYAATSAADLDLLDAIGQELGLELQFQAFSRGGSDASCAASHGLCARPITLGLPMANSHGYEIMHRGAMTELARLTTALLNRLTNP
jgi:putative aminopeptidase FrvX